MASVQAHAVVEHGLALLLLLITRVGQPTVALEQQSWAEVLLLVPPVAGAGCRAAGAQDALVQTIKLASLSDGLAVFLSVWAGSCALQVWLDGLVLLVEVGQIRDNVLDDVHVWQWVDLGLFCSVGWDTAYMTIC